MANTHKKGKSMGIKKGRNKKREEEKKGGSEEETSGLVCVCSKFNFIS